MSVPEPEILQGTRQGLSASPRRSVPAPTSSRASTIGPGDRAGSQRRIQLGRRICSTNQGAGQDRKKLTFREIPEPVDRISRTEDRRRRHAARRSDRFPVDHSRPRRPQIGVITLPGTRHQLHADQHVGGAVHRHQGPEAHRLGDQPEGDSRQHLQRRRPGGAQLPDQLAAGIEGRSASSTSPTTRPRLGRCSTKPAGS